MRSLLVVLLLMLAGCGETTLYSALPESQANAVQAALLAVGIDALKQPVKEGASWAILVGKQSVPQALAVLQAQGLPRSGDTSMGEVFKKDGFVSSPLEERARYLYALSQELSHTLMEIDGVVAARVHVALPEHSLLDQATQSASAAVVIVQAPGVDLSRYETDIKAIVTDGVEGLDDVNRVTVKFFSRAPVTLPARRQPPAMAGLVSNPLALAGAAIVFTLGGVGGVGGAYWWRRRGQSGAGSKSENEGANHVA